MNNREIAFEFLRSYCGGDVNGLVLLLAADLRFNGPFYSFTSRDTYLSSFRNNPPE